MKGWLIFGLICVSMTGCVVGENEEVVQTIAYQHSPTLTFSEIDPGKQPMKWELTLIDGRTDERQSILLNEYGYPAKPLDEQSLATFAAELASGIDQPMVNPTIDLQGNIQPGQKRIILSEAELVESIKQLTYIDSELQLPIYETEPTLTAEDLEGILNFELGSYKTYFNAGVTGRTTNIKLSSEAIQHHVLAPGDVFSFNSVVGQRTKERGYQEAKEIVNKEFVMGIGGGICQTSSTLFNAVDNAGLEIVERYSHSRDIGYVPPNRDATVSWGGPDFKFKNQYDVPILIQTEVHNGVVEVRILSSKPTDKLLVSR
ncbi:VanW family protein [Bacillus alkalicellulosilyticus]|uniref:VanW family protein n=1 Tax=Alkalihalobacterium alkalicellulosilyticum TaxID=1912214 RepID=UPI001FEA7AAF|nr:VanW family protein [Bacillus alkalicellulosilyticus]